MGQGQTRAEPAEELKKSFCDSLALFVGANRRYGVEEVAAATGISTDSLHRYLRGETCPKWDKAVQLLTVLPVEFGLALLRPAGLTGLRRIDGDSSGPETMRDIALAAADQAAALADGRIDHTERPVIRRSLNTAMVAIATYLAREDEA